MRNKNISHPNTNLAIMPLIVLSQTRVLLPSLGDVAVTSGL